MRTTSLGSQIAGLGAWLGLTLLAAAAGSVASIRAREVYATLVRPDWAPPGWVFGPVWSVLYLMMAIAAWLVWRERDTHAVRPALALYVAQLGLNAAWSWLFFAWRSGLWATVGVLVLWVLVLATIAAFWRVRVIAGVLLLPYFGWVTFAAILCITVWRLNPGALGS
jgi:translocator protein